MSSIKKLEQFMKEFQEFQSSVKNVKLENAVKALPQKDYMSDEKFIGKLTPSLLAMATAGVGAPKQINLIQEATRTTSQTYRNIASMHHSMKKFDRMLGNFKCCDLDIILERQEMNEMELQLLDIKYRFNIICRKKSAALQK